MFNSKHLWEHFASSSSPCPFLIHGDFKASGKKKKKFFPQQIPSISISISIYHCIINNHISQFFKVRSSVWVNYNCMQGLFRL